MWFRYIFTTEYDPATVGQAENTAMSLKIDSKYGTNEWCMYYLKCLGMMLLTQKAVARVI